MKKKFLLVAFASLMLISTTFAKEIASVPNQVISSLHEDFSNVTNVEWKTTSNFYKASFTTNNKQLEAFYSVDGQLIGVSRSITMEHLPITLIKETIQKRSNSQITDLFELSSDRGTEYFITFKNDKGTKTYRSTGDSWSRYF